MSGDRFILTYCSGHLGQKIFYGPYTREEKVEFEKSFFYKNIKNDVYWNDPINQKLIDKCDFGKYYYFVWVEGVRIFYGPFPTLLSTYK